MKRRKVLTGFDKFLSEERRANVERDWKYLPPLQQLRFTLLILWHSSPTLPQIIEHIQFFYLRWLEPRLYPAHWVR
jgi:hypothetical protein